MPLRPSPLLCPEGKGGDKSLGTASCEGSGDKEIFQSIAFLHFFTQLIFKTFPYNKIAHICHKSKNTCLCPHRWHFAGRRRIDSGSRQARGFLPQDFRLLCVHQRRLSVFRGLSAFCIKTVSNFHPSCALCTILCHFSAMKSLVFAVFLCICYQKIPCFFPVGKVFSDCSAIFFLPNCIWMCIILTLSFWNPFQKI